MSAAGERGDGALACAVGLTALAVYLRTLAPSVVGGDSGELVTAAWGLGVAHPPGFPLWTLLAHAASLVPLGEVAWRINLFSALAASGAVAFVFLAARRLGVERAPAAAAALLLAFSRDFWASALVAEVYSLDAALLALALWQLIAWRASGRDAHLVTAALAYGFGLTNHWMLTLLMAPPIGLYVLAPGAARPLHLRALGHAALAVGAPLLTYAYLPWAARRAPALNWGDPSSLERFWRHVSRASYREIEEATTGGAADVLTFLGAFADRWLEQVTPWLLLPLLAGAVLSLRRRRAEAALLLGLIAFASFVLIVLRRPVAVPENLRIVAAWWMPAWIASALACACGLDWWLAAARRRGARVRAAAVALTLGTPLVPAVAGFGYNDRSDFDWIAELNRAALESLAPDAVYVPGPDHRSFPALYLHRVEGIRPDVLLADVIGVPEPAALAYAESIGVEPAPRSTPVFAAAVVSGPRPVYVTRRVDVEAPARFRLLATPTAYRLLPAQGSAAADEDVPAARPPEPPGGVPRDASERLLLSELRRLDAERALARGDGTHAAWAFSEAIELAWDERMALNNLAGVLAQHGRSDEAERCLLRALEIDPGYVKARENLDRLAAPGPGG